jgi:hypothetical protein
MWTLSQASQAIKDNNWTGLPPQNVEFLVVAGGGGGGKAGTNNAGGGGMDISPLIAEMQNVKAVLSQILAKEGVVYMDSTKVGTTMNIGTYKTQ